MFYFLSFQHISSSAVDGSDGVDDLLCSLASGLEQFVHLLLDCFLVIRFLYLYLIDERLQLFVLTSEFTTVILDHLYESVCNASDRDFCDAVDFRTDFRLNAFDLRN